MKKQNLVSLAVGSAFAAIALSPVAHAADNPFAATQLQSAYQLAQAGDKKVDGKCGEAKCGADKKAAEKKKDGSCGADKKKDASCGADKKVEGKCGADKKTEGKCGANK